MYEPCYASREDVQRALDVKDTYRNFVQIDRAIQDASRDIEGGLHRRFYPHDDTRFFDWPNYQYADPWRLWLEQNELAAKATVILLGTQNLNLVQVFFGSGGGTAWRNEPPFTMIELDRSTIAAFGGNATTPQRSIAITGTFGYNTDTAPAGTLAASLTDTTGTSVTVSDGSLLGVGNILIAGTERMLVSDRAFTSTSVTLAGPGVETALNNDTQLTASASNVFGIGEYLRIDQEQLLVTDQLDATNYTVQRAWNGTTLAAHSNGAAISASRLLTVTRGALGTTAATHSSAAALTIHRVPSTIRNLAIAEAENHVLQETSGYSREVGEGANLRQATGSALDEAWGSAIRRYGRKARSRVV